MHATDSGSGSQVLLDLLVVLIGDNFVTTILAGTWQPGLCHFLRVTHLHALVQVCRSCMQAAHLDCGVQSHEHHPDSNNWGAPTHDDIHTTSTGKLAQLRAI